MKCDKVACHKSSQVADSFFNRVGGLGHGGHTSGEREPGAEAVRPIHQLHMLGERDVLRKIIPSRIKAGLNRGSVSDTEKEDLPALCVTLGTMSIFMCPAGNAAEAVGIVFVVGGKNSIEHRNLQD